MSIKVKKAVKQRDGLQGLWIQVLARLYGKGRNKRYRKVIAPYQFSCGGRIHSQYQRMANLLRDGANMVGAQNDQLANNCSRRCPSVVCENALLIACKVVSPLVLEWRTT